MTCGRVLLGSGFVLALAGGVLVFVVHLHFIVIPLTLLALGLAAYLLNPQKALLWFLFALPWTAALPALDPNGYPFNYMGVPLFLLSGMILASMARRERLDARHPVAYMAAILVLITIVSTVFLLLRWSNLTIPGLAFLKDTPVTPEGQRVSFAIVFPVITLMLTAISPHLFTMLRRHKPSRTRALNHLFAGYAVTLGIALIQRFVAPGFLSRGYFVFHKQLNGGTSDFNAFGFLSGFVFLAALLNLLRRKTTTNPLWTRSPLLAAIVMAGSLSGLVLSGSRTGFLFVLSAAAVALSSKKWRLRTRMLMLIACILMLAVGGGVLRQRIARTVTDFHDNLKNHGLISALDRASNQRITMMRSGFQLVSTAPLTGVGGGNFLFALKNLHLGQGHLEDLPLNQYLLAASETGAIGALLFLALLGVMIRKPRHRQWRPLFWTTLAAFLVGTPLWLPELALLFWFMAWLLDPEPHSEKIRLFRRPVLIAAMLASLFALGCLWESPGLHPLRWCLQKRAPYDYGMWPAEQTPEGHTFNWTRGSAGVYLRPGLRTAIRLVANAPFANLPDRTQKIQVFWRGRLYREVMAAAVAEWPLILHSSRGGFLEFRVTPPFNLRHMGLGREGRTLGVQVHGLTH